MQHPFKQRVKGIIELLPIASGRENLPPKRSHLWSDGSPSEAFQVSPIGSKCTSLRTSGRRAVVRVAGKRISRGPSTVHHRTIVTVGKSWAVADWRRLEPTDIRPELFLLRWECQSIPR
jgi:hypothetical protein